MKPGTKPGSGSPIRVVVIDDDDFQREFLVSLLAGKRFAVTGLASVFGLTNHLVQERVQVVILDVMMPTIRGDKLAALLRKNPALSRLRVVLVSSLPEEEVAQLIEQVRVDAFVAKSEVRERLAAVVTALVSK